MGYRRRMTSRQSRKNFRKGAKVHGRNFAEAMRGGYRI